MTKEEIINRAIPILRDNPLVLSCSLFGSYAKNQESENSDIDFLLTLKHSASLLDRVEIQLALEKKMGTHIDVVSPKMLHPYIKEKVNKEKIDFYEQ
jgi:predicted nucleotidyltransferase